MFCVEDCATSRPLLNRLFYTFCSSIVLGGLGATDDIDNAIFSYY